MDLLTDILTQAGLRRRVLQMRALPTDRALLFPCEKSIGMHVVTQGRAYVHPPAGEPVALTQGDIAIMARGCVHLLSTQATIAGLAREPIAAHIGDPPRAAPDDMQAHNVVVSGAYQLWHAPVHPLFELLPSWFVLRADALGPASPIAGALSLLETELRRRDLGADVIVHGLLDVIFAYVLRHVVELLQPDEANWIVAIRDASVRDAVQLMHEDCGRAWTLEDLARGVGVSRAGLAAKFRAAMGTTPANYLRTVRMQRAIRLLSETQHTLESVAAKVGYQDAFSFSKVFKRTVGVSPSAFRKRDDAERHTPWRFTNPLSIAQAGQVGAPPL